MEELTKAEERIMHIIWDLDRCFVKDIIEKIVEEPKPPYNTVSSVVRILEKKGYVGFKAYGKTYEYFPLVSKEDYGHFSFKKVFACYFNNSAESLLSFLVKDNTISEAEIEQLKLFIDKQ